jgi:hypothetical protein
MEKGNVAEELQKLGFIFEMSNSIGKVGGNGFLLEGCIVTANHVALEYSTVPGKGAVTFKQIPSKDIAISDKLSTGGLTIGQTAKEGDKVKIVTVFNGKQMIIEGELDILGPIYRGKMQIITALDKLGWSVIQNGMSGSAVIDESGNVVGVLVESNHKFGMMELFE